MLTFRYSQWDGTQVVFAPDHDELMDAIADDLMNHGDVNRALRDMMRRGMQMPDGQRMEGLRDMMERLRQQRQQQFQRERYTTLLGETDFTKLADFKRWLDQHPEQSQIKQYLITTAE